MMLWKSFSRLGTISKNSRFCSIVKVILAGFVGAVVNDLILYLHFNLEKNNYYQVKGLI